jgi:hypothetical protein
VRAGGRGRAGRLLRIATSPDVEYEDSSHKALLYLDLFLRCHQLPSSCKANSMINIFICAGVLDPRAM